MINNNGMNWNWERNSKIFLLGIIGDKGFFFNPKNVLDTGWPFIIGYKPKKIKSEEDKLHNSVVAQLRVVVENFIWSNEEI